MDKLRDRLALGRERYGHGVRIGDDTREWGTKEDSWMEMAHEEFLDGIIYVVADYLRKESSEPPSPTDDNERILHCIEDTSLITSQYHRAAVRVLYALITAA